MQVEGHLLWMARNLKFYMFMESHEVMFTLEHAQLFFDPRGPYLGFG
jgi:hypothetical protein